MGGFASTPAALRSDIRTWPGIAVGAPPWALYVAAVALLGVAYFTIGADDIAQAAIYEAVGVGAVAAIGVGLRRHGPARKLPWLLFATGLFLWVVGDTYWDVYSWFLDAQAPFPSFADLAYMAGYPLLIAATFVLARGWGRPRLSDILDSSLVALGALILTWALLVEPMLAQTGLSTAGMTVTVASPVLDVLLLIGVVQLCLRKGVDNLALRLLVVGLACQVIADFAYSYLNLKGAYANGMFVDAGWIVAYGLFGAAALHPSMAEVRTLPRRMESRSSGWRVGALATATMLVPATLLVDSAQGDPVNAVELALVSFLVTALVAARLVLLQRERDRILAAVAVGRQKYRELFEQSDEARAALAEQNDRLRELDHLKDNLISVVSHELRTPLTSILGYLELLEQDRDQLSQRQRHFLGVVDRNAERLLGLVVDLLFMTQVRAGQLTLEREPVDLSEVVHQAVEAALPTAQERQISVSVVPCAGATVNGDRQRLGQVLDNLLSNALKFTARSGAVRLRLSATEGEVLLEVGDNGMGIAAGEQRELFSRFFRADAAIESAIQGTGLGLSIVKAIVEGHGGQVGVESVEGEGANFRVTLPRLAASESEPVKSAA